LPARGGALTGAGAGLGLLLRLTPGLLEGVRDGLGGAGQRPLGLAAGARLGHLADQIGQTRVLAGPGLQVEAVARLREPLLRVNAGVDDPHVDLEDLDADQGHAHECVADEPPVEYELEYVVEAAAAAAATGLLCRYDCHVRIVLLGRYVGPAGRPSGRRPCVRRNVLARSAGRGGNR